MTKELDRKRVDKIIRFALKEDIWTGDITTEAVINTFLKASAVILSREEAVICGMGIIERVFASVDYNLRFKPLVKDGEIIQPGQEIAYIEGEAHSILKGERTALNFLGLLSGISTRTHEMVERIKGTKTKVFDTRKTIPLHRYLQKYAVKTGGGHNHRLGLWDMVLIKDNHIRAFEMQLKTSDSGKAIKEIIKRTRQSVQKNIRVEIEVETLKECECALEEKPDIIMLDNMAPEEVKKAVLLRRKKKLEKKVLFEVSGGITLDNIKTYAETGIDIVSVGSLTSCIKAVDFSLEIVFREE